MKFFVCYNDNPSKELHKTVRITAPTQWKKSPASDIVKKFVKPYNTAMANIKSNHKLDPELVHLAVLDTTTKNDPVASYKPIPSDVPIVSCISSKQDDIVFIRHGPSMTQSEMLLQQTAAIATVTMPTATESTESSVSTVSTTTTPTTPTTTPSPITTTTPDTSASNAADTDTLITRVPKQLEENQSSQPQYQSQDKNNAQQQTKRPQQQLENQSHNHQQHHDTTTTATATTTSSSSSIRRCARYGCGNVYIGMEEKEEKEEEELSDNTFGPCLFHKSPPVFLHNEMYWTCCPNRKVSNFTELMSIRGCQVSMHCTLDEKLFLQEVVATTGTATKTKAETETVTEKNNGKKTDIISKNNIDPIASASTTTQNQNQNQQQEEEIRNPEIDKNIENAGTGAEAVIVACVHDDPTTTIDQNSPSGQPTENGISTTTITDAADAAAAAAAAAAATTTKVTGMNTNPQVESILIQFKNVLHSFGVDPMLYDSVIDDMKRDFETLEMDEDRLNETVKNKLGNMLQASFKAVANSPKPMNKTISIGRNNSTSICTTMNTNSNQEDRDDYDVDEKQQLEIHHSATRTDNNNTSIITENDIYPTSYSLVYKIANADDSILLDVDDGGVINGALLQTKPKSPLIPTLSNAVPVSNGINSSIIQLQTMLVNAWGLTSSLSTTSTATTTTAAAMPSAVATAAPARELNDVNRFSTMNIKQNSTSVYDNIMNYSKMNGVAVNHGNPTNNINNNDNSNSTNAKKTILEEISDSIANAVMDVSSHIKNSNCTMCNCSSSSSNIAAITAASSE